MFGLFCGLTAFQVLVFVICLYQGNTTSALVNAAITASHVAHAVKYRK